MLFSTLFPRCIYFLFTVTIKVLSGRYIIMDRLKELRVKMGLSQQALADKLNVSQQSICKYENDTIEPNIDMLKTMADLFDVSVDYLIGYSSYTHKVEEVFDTDLNADELSVLQKYRALSPSSRTLVKQFMNEFLRLSGE